MPDLTERPADESAKSAKLLQDYHLELRRFLRQRLRAPADIDDLAQEVFARFLRAGSEELRNPRAYLFGIAAHVVREFRMRSLQEQDWVTVDSTLADSASERLSNAEPGELAERLSVQRQLLHALRQLPPMQRAVLLMVKYEGRSHEEVAQATRLSVNTIERYVVEARAKIKALMWDPQE